MMLVINICKEKLHYHEFVKPIEAVLEKNETKFKTVHYFQLTKKDIIKKADKIIICGTSLKDNRYLEDFEMFQWIKDFNGPVLGICGGMQIIQSLFDGKKGKNKEIGFYEESFTKEFLGMKGKQEVYHLHNNYVSLPKSFTKYTKSEIPQAIKHRTKPIYGVLFHPEVRNKELIENFIKL